jgi:hypothetical protein
MMNYVTIFVASDAPYRNLSFVAPGVVFMAVALMMVFRPKWFEIIPFFSPSPKGPWFRPLAIAILLFSVIWTVGAGGTILGRDVNAKRALEAGDCETIEGRVEHFHPMPKSGHDMERFEVAGVKFEYSDYVLSAGFNNTASHGGPIYEGLPVRICHRDGAILRLEIAR